MSGELSDAEGRMLSHLNPRRFELLLIAARFGGPFTAPQLREAAAGHSTSLTRDLNALEEAGLLIANPPASEPRQGRPVNFWLAPDVPELFARLSDLVSEACSTLPPSS
jgi:hypothetical protein